MALALPASAAANELVTFDVPSRHVDVAAQPVGPPPPGQPERPNNLGVNVLLPDGYSESGRKRYPLLFLLHGAAQAYDHWAAPEFGNIAERTKDFPGIIVMPQGGVIGFYSDWFNDGERGGPGWESYYLRELLPEIERRYRIRKGRRWHAIAGLSMGGFGTMYLASQRPGYFGAAASFSGVLSPQDDQQLTLVANAIINPALNIEYEDIFGPDEGFNAVGHNPSRLTDNLAATRLFVSSGDATPCPGDDDLGQNFGGLGPQAGPAFNPPLFTPFVPGVLVGLETITRRESDVFVARAREAGLEPNEIRDCGIHWWETFNRGFDAALEWGFYKQPPPKPAAWTYRTASQRAAAWGLRFALAEPPTALTVLHREGATLRGEGEGTLRVRTRGCRFTAALPFERTLARRCVRALR